MSEPQVILMPGLDGTGELFAPLLDVMPPSLPRRALSYPADRAIGYEGLLEVVTGDLAGDLPLILIAESFSGPLAIRYAATHAGRVRAVVLCASFIVSPAPRWLRRLVCPALFRWAPSPGVRMLLTGWRAPRTLVEAVRRSIARVRPAVLAHRVREVLAVDCASELATLSMPILYLRARHDALVRMDSLQRVRAAHGGVAVRSISGPHLLLQASPAEAWRSIEEFLRRRRGVDDHVAADAVEDTGACGGADKLGG